LDSFDPARLHARNGFLRWPCFFSSVVRSSTGFRAADEAEDEEDEEDELDEELEDDDGG
jgi:hypothetical protein